MKLLDEKKKDLTMHPDYGTSEIVFEFDIYSSQ